MIELNDIHKTLPDGGTRSTPCRGSRSRSSAGDFVAIMGPSGSGKSTLMHILGLLDRPDSGSYRLYGREISKLGDDELAVLRRERSVSSSSSSTSCPA